MAIQWRCRQWWMHALRWPFCDLLVVQWHLRVMDMHSGKSDDNGMFSSDSHEKRDGVLWVLHQWQIYLKSAAMVVWVCWARWHNNEDSLCSRVSQHWENRDFVWVFYTDRCLSQSGSPGSLSSQQTSSVSTSKLRPWWKVALSRGLFHSLPATFVQTSKAYSDTFLFPCATISRCSPISLDKSSTKQL